MGSLIVKGAVFWYDHAGVRDKTQHLVKFKDKDLRSSVIAGKRPWVVIAEPKEGVREKLCTIVPMSSSETIEARGRVQFRRKGKLHTILVEQVQTVDPSVLREYFYQMKEDTLRLVDEALIKHLSLEIKPDSKDMEIADLKAKIAKYEEDTKEVKEFKGQRANLARLLKDRERRMKELEREVIQLREITGAKRKRKSWDRERAEKFLRACERYSVEDVESLYGYKAGTVNSTKRRLKERFNI